MGSIRDTEEWKELTRKLITSKPMRWQMQGFVEACNEEVE